MAKIGQYKKINIGGGIYAIIPLNPPFYDESIAESVRWRLRKILGVKIKGLENSALNTLISQKLVERIEPIIKSLGNYEFASQTGELAGSYGFAIYHKGIRVPNTLTATPIGGWGSANEDNMKRFFDINGRRLRSLLRSSDWSILVANYCYYAARMESNSAYPDNKYMGYAKSVMRNFIYGVSQSIRSAMGRKGSEIMYGYILSRQGYEGQILQLT